MKNTFIKSAWAGILAVSLGFGLEVNSTNYFDYVSNITASSSETNVSDNGPLNVFNGDVNSKWHSEWQSGSESLPQWLEITFSDTLKIDSLKLFARTDNVHGQIEDGEILINGVTAGTMTDVPENTDATVSFSETQSALALRVLITESHFTGAGEGKWASIGEIVIYADTTSEAVDTTGGNPTNLVPLASQELHSVFFLQGGEFALPQGVRQATFFDLQGNRVMQVSHRNTVSLPANKVLLVRYE